MHAFIPTLLTPLPPPQNLLPHFFLDLPNLHPNRPTRPLHILLPLLRLTPPPRTQIPSGTRTQRGKQIHLREEVYKTVLRRGTTLHEIPALGIEASHLEHVEHVVDVEFCESVWEHGAHEVRVAVEVVRGRGEHVRDVGVAARAEEVVAAAVPAGDFAPFVGG